LPKFPGRIKNASFHSVSLARRRKEISSDGANQVLGSSSYLQQAKASSFDTMPGNYSPILEVHLHDSSKASAQGLQKPYQALSLYRPLKGIEDIEPCEYCKCLNSSVLIGTSVLLKPQITTIDRKKTRGPYLTGADIGNEVGSDAVGAT
jgi:hypothetical protein